MLVRVRVTAVVWAIVVLLFKLAVGRPGADQPGGVQGEVHRVPEDPRRPIHTSFKCDSDLHGWLLRRLLQ